MLNSTRVAPGVKNVLEKTRNRCLNRDESCWNKSSRSKNCTFGLYGCMCGACVFIQDLI